MPTINDISSRLDKQEAQFKGHVDGCTILLKELSEKIDAAVRSLSSKIDTINQRTAHDDAVEEGIRKANQDRQSDTDRRQNRTVALIGAYAGIATIIGVVLTAYVLLHHPQTVTISESTSVTTHPNPSVGH